MAAPKPKPAALKLLEGRGNGRDSGGRKVLNPPAFKRLSPTPPDWLSDEAAAEWARVMPELERLNLVKVPDAAALVAYCETWARFVTATRLVAEQGILHSNSQGEVTAPWVGVAERAGRELRAFATEFGLTPAAEMKLATETSDGGDQASEFQAT